MKVLLCLGNAGPYYAGRKQWVRDRERAIDLRTINRATDVGHEEDLDSVVIVLAYGDPSYDWFLPLPRQHGLPFQAAPANAQALLSRAV
ncbi:MAG: hypothetical protein NT154_32220 [Verrucomicrobia bacterium]|nr:hypothetical protein [Verrucomicrobiota bacterium]